MWRSELSGFFNALFVIDKNDYLVLMKEKEPAGGAMLIANPHLEDPNFLRSVIFLCEHSSQGSFGFVLNRKSSYTLDELVPELADFKLPVFEGGPVELNTLHFLHRFPEEIDDSREVMNGIYWGGNFEQLVALIHSRQIDTSDVRFFLGYSGWSEGQLEFEMDEKTWIVADAAEKFLFKSDEKELWKDVLNHLGGEYRLIINAPIDPHLN